MLGWLNHKLESRLSEVINNLRNADDTILMAQSEEVPPDEDERGEWKIWLKIQYSKS